MHNIKKLDHNNKEINSAINVNVNVFPPLTYDIYSYIHSGEAESHQLPPCQDSLYKHCRRANYQAAIWKNSLRNNDIPSPVGHGWSLVNDGAQERLVIDWMSGLPAPTAVIELMSCMCKKACNDDSCDCIRNGLKCSDLCRLITCSNQPDEEEDIQVDLDEEHVDFD